MDLSRRAAEATRRARLVERLLLDRVQQDAAAKLREEDPKDPVLVAVTWTCDSPGAFINNRTYSGREGDLHLLEESVADVLVQAGHAQLREPLQLPAAQRPEVAAELRSIAEVLQAAAGELDPQQG
jgi:hypothetical protein